MKAIAFAAALACGTILAGCSAASGSNVKSVSAAPVSDESQAGEGNLEELLAQMSLERKVAQLVMPDIGSITPEDVAKYRFGTVLNGGNSGPNNNDLAPAHEWLELADAYWDASLEPLPDGELPIPVLWGTDAVHGHANIIGATVFPHNIGLGATGDANLIRRIGKATAVEIEVTGIDWTFAPTVAVARDDRWGRTYESYSEDPQLVALMGAAMIEGLQGSSATGRIGEGHVAATAKHFFGDGGTEQGVDQGDVNGDLDALMAIHAAPYPAAIDAGVASIMASFNSINGRKMHGNGPLLDDELRGNLGFNGLVVGDWNGHGQIKGCTNSDCPQALLAGLDVYMVPEEWKPLYENLIEQVRDGTIPMERLDEAVLRVLRMKRQLGMLDDGALRPSDRPHAGNWEELGAPAHRAVAREAVAKSLVLLKNDGVLPIKTGANILVAGSAADNIPQQAGGWSVTWQGGGDLTAEHFPGATSIYQGISAQAVVAGSTAVLSSEGELPDSAVDVAIVVFGEQPYAEFVGDRKDTVLRDEEGLSLLKKFKDAQIPTVAVFLSGRPLWMNREINAANAFVAAWLPGSEGAGVADVLFGARDVSGKLSFSWPSTCEGNPLNSSDGALFPLGFGLGYDRASETNKLHEECAALDIGDAASWFTAGRLSPLIQAVADNAVLTDLRGAGNGVSAFGLDRNAQEDARRIVFQAGASLTLRGPKSRAGWRIAYKVDARPSDTVTVTAGGEDFDISQPMFVAEGKGWREMVLTEQCLGETGGALTFASSGFLSIDVSEITRIESAEGTQCSF